MPASPQDARDAAPGKQTGNVDIRNPYGSSNWGTLFRPWDYTGQAQMNINKGNQTRAEAEQLSKQHYAPGAQVPYTAPGSVPQPGDALKPENRRYNTTGGDVNGFGEPYTPADSTPPANTGSAPSQPPAGGTTLSDLGNIISSGSAQGTPAPGTNGDISYQQDPEMKKQFLEVIDLLKQQGMGDLQAQKAALDWYQKQHGQADEDRTKMMDWANAVLGTGSYAGKSFDPNNPQAFSGIAADVAGIQGDMDQRLKQLDESSLDPATKMRMKEEILNGAYSGKAAARQNQITSARQYISHDQDRASGVQQAPQTGGAGQAAGAANANLGMQLSADVQAGDQGLRRAQFNSELEYRRAKDAQDEAFRQQQLSQSGSQFDRDLELRKFLAQQQAKGGKTNWLSTLGNLLGKVPLGSGGSGSDPFGGGGTYRGDGTWSTSSPGEDLGDYTYLGDDTPNMGPQPPGNSGGSVPPYLAPNNNGTVNNPWTPGGGLW